MLEARTLLYSIDSNTPKAVYTLSNNLSSLITEDISANSKLVILCVGTDRSTGDCLGPLVGYKLSTSYKFKDSYLFGTLNNPVHAKNLENNITYIKETIDNPYIIAIDASLGKCENIGKINLYKGPLYPGAGVSKDLTPVGDVSITGIVNMSGFMEYVILQNTRLSLVMRMAEIISRGLYLALRKIEKEREELILDN